MKVKFKATPEGEVAIVPRAEYERLKALEQETEEDSGAARLIARAKREVAGGAPVLRKTSSIVLRMVKIQYGCCANFAKRPRPNSPWQLELHRTICPIWKPATAKARSNCIRRLHGFSEFHSICWRPSR